MHTELPPTFDPANFAAVAPVTPDELARMRDALQRCIASGIKTVEYDGRKVEYQTIADMRRALADLERRIANAASRPKTVLLQTSKGVL